MLNHPLQRGFTLLEVMVALVIFCPLSVAASGVLLSLLRSQAATEEQDARLATLQRLVMTLHHDISQAAPRLPDTTPGDDAHPYIQIEAPGMIFTALNWRNPLDEPRGTLASLHYVFASGALTRQVWPLAQTSPDRPVLSHRLADHIGRITFSIVAVPPPASTAAPAAAAPGPVNAPATPPAFPAAISIGALLPPFGEVQLLVPTVQTP